MALEKFYTCSKTNFLNKKRLVLITAACYMIIKRRYPCNKIKILDKKKLVFATAFHYMSW